MIVEEDLSDKSQYEQASKFRNETENNIEEVKIEEQPN